MSSSDPRQRIAGGSIQSGVGRNSTLKPHDQRSVNFRGVLRDQEKPRLSSNLVIKEGIRQSERINPFVEGKGKGISVDVDQNVKEEAFLGRYVLLKSRQSKQSAKETLDVAVQVKENPIAVNKFQVLDCDVEEGEIVERMNVKIFSKSIDLDSVEAVGSPDVQKVYFHRFGPKSKLIEKDDIEIDDEKRRRFGAGDAVIYSNDKMKITKKKHREGETLPHFGQLPFLEPLKFSDMQKVKWIENKFPGNDNYRVFHFLEVLHVERLEALEYLFEAGVDTEDGCLFSWIIEVVIGPADRQIVPGRSDQFGSSWTVPRTILRPTFSTVPIGLDDVLNRPGRCPQSAWTICTENHLEQIWAHSGGEFPLIVPGRSRSSWTILEQIFDITFRVGMR
ncbi:hypothetical protein MA16_Dca006826 [Dendrobium catenatum]|uniref:Uncharacterized protein n=1 Tax=Dendrobium catenatum TaxID=906689 RepID=A0A2I0VSW2_9ASPA|nr:hypothetical protein MA16_Dca006826 [Dendrobium catenatum]